MGICPDKSAGAEKRAAEISGCNNNTVGQILFKKNIKHGYPCRALRLTVIGIPSSLTVPEDVGVDIVGRIPMLRFYLIYKGDRLILSCDGLNIADKS